MDETLKDNLRKTLLYGNIQERLEVAMRKDLDEELVFLALRDPSVMVAIKMGWGAICSFRQVVEAHKSKCINFERGCVCHYRNGEIVVLIAESTDMVNSQWWYALNNDNKHRVIDPQDGDLRPMGELGRLIYG